ncbi:TonB-dependent receptor (plasmid) [Bartonella sp. HY329]|uniref:TonB-dependent receptor n=1 Tax=unclassified Bartonella TaxID=2645622 RepID=UPI0021CA9848|nr:MULTISPECIES: TonB-dependent receptor [unclassified Bartonella]UXM96452.1 TonB-dependent receptor [Bartonella sp. HY329]UXN10775.1 TonB-dependent receptor [Bartonella sp. HY328]
MKNRFKRSCITSTAAIALLATNVISVFAQDTASVDSNSTTLEAIVITGEKIDRDIRNTASSVSVITAKDIWNNKFSDQSVHDVINGLPNVLYTDSVSAPIIRGQDTQGPNTRADVFWGGTVPRASTNIDGHYANYYELFFGSSGLWDVSSIEVFKGPQTTSQGANAIAGAVVINTKDPTFTKEAAYQAEIGNYGQRRTSFMVSGPIYKNELAGRIAIDYSRRDTFIDYNNPNFLSRDVNLDFRYFNGRAKLLWQPAEIPGLEAKLTYSRTNNNQPTQEMASVPYDDLKYNFNMMPGWKQKTDTGIFDVSYEFENGMKLYNTVQYSHFNVLRRTGVPIRGDADITQNNISNESRLTFGNEDDVLSGVAGVFFNQVKSDDFLLFVGTTQFDDKKRNFGIFGETSYKLTDQWTLTGGLRYQHDQVTRIGRSSLTPNPLNYDETFSAFLPKVSLAYAINPDWTVGALINRGYNPGGVSLNLNSRQWMSFEPEKVWNYELFTRVALLENRLTLNSNIFYMDFKNNQYNIPVVISPGVAQSYTINAEKAHSYGLELGFDYAILDNLQLRAGAGLLRTEIDEISSNVAYQGNEFAKSPGYMLNAGFSWDITEKFKFSGDVRHLDKYYSDVANTPSYVIDAYTISDLRMSYNFNDAIEIYGFVNNLFDERVATYKAANSSLNSIDASVTMPRNYGIGIRGTF